MGELLTLYPQVDNFRIKGLCILIHTFTAPTSKTTIFFNNNYTNQVHLFRR